MIRDQTVLTTSASLGKSKPALPRTSVRRRIGSQYLHTAFRESQPLAALTGSSTSEARRVIDSFLAAIGDDVHVARIDKTCADVLAGMREVIRQTGFEPNDMNLINLEIMFAKFLSRQRFHHRRTIFVLEETPDNDGWVRDKVRNLVDLETAGNFGLMVILSRQTGTHAAGIALTPDADTPADAETDSDSIELRLNLDSNDTVPLRTILTHNGQRLHELTLEQPRMMIGRSEDNDLCINNKNVSRHHAILIRLGAAAVVMDLNSTNGTFVNSRRIKEQIVVHHDIIAIGNHYIKYIAPNVQHW